MAEFPKLRPMVLKALEATAREDGWATLFALGSQLTAMVLAMVTYLPQVSLWLPRQLGL